MTEAAKAEVELVPAVGSKTFKSGVYVLTYVPEQEVYFLALGETKHGMAPLAFSQLELVIQAMRTAQAQ